MVQKQQKMAKNKQIQNFAKKIEKTLQNNLKQNFAKTAKNKQILLKIWKKTRTNFSRKITQNFPKTLQKNKKLQNPSSFASKILIFIKKKYV